MRAACRLEQACACGSERRSDTRVRATYENLSVWRERTVGSLLKHAAASQRRANTISAVAYDARGNSSVAAVTAFR